MEVGRDYRGCNFFCEKIDLGHPFSLQFEFYHKQSTSTFVSGDVVALQRKGTFQTMIADFKRIE